MDQEYYGLTGTHLRLSVFVSEVAHLTTQKQRDIRDKEWLPYPAPIAVRKLQCLTKEEARQALAQVAEIALDMAENIDEWWKD